MAIEREGRNTTKFNRGLRKLSSLTSGRKHARIHNIGNRNNVDIYWDLNKRGIHHAAFKIVISTTENGEKKQMEAVIPYEELAYYARDF